MVLCSNGGPGWWLDPVLSISLNLESGHTWDHGTLYSLLEFLVKFANVSTSTIPSGQSAACNEAGAAGGGCTSWAVQISGPTLPGPGHPTPSPATSPLQPPGSTSTSRLQFSAPCQVEIGTFASHTYWTIQHFTALSCPKSKGQTPLSMFSCAKYEMTAV